eukprot:3223630-Pleurochrysis_carterae.AAC.1
MEGRGHPIGKIRVDEENVVSVARNVNVQKIAHWAFVLNVPTRCQVRCEGFVEGAYAIIGV